jgi:small conductance mechanosensitive channel
VRHLGSFATKLRGWLLIPLLAGAFLSCVPPLSADAPAQPPVGNADNIVAKPVLVEPEAADEAIAERIKRILLSTAWFQATGVSVRDGVVFLDGRTKTQERKRWAEALAENTQGTVAVVNRIAVENDIGSTFDQAGDEFERLYRQAAQAWPWAVFAMAIILLTWFLARMTAIAVRYFLARRISSPLLLTMAVRAFTIPIFLLGIYFVLQVAGLTRLALTVLGGTGLLGIVVGFAFRDIAENFLASMLLSIRNPFRTGELIEVDGNVGVVMNLNVRSTVLRTLDGTYVQIPNALVYKSTIRNYSSAENRRADFAVGIGYDSPTTKAQTLIADVLRQHPAVLETPEPLVLVEELGSATVNLRIYYWFASAVYSPDKINSALLRLSKDALLKGGIELPDPAREVVFPKGIPVFRAENVGRADAATMEAAERSHAEEAGLPATIGEGELRNETGGESLLPDGSSPEAETNLLKG